MLPSCDPLLCHAPAAPLATLSVLPQALLISCTLLDLRPFPALSTELSSPSMQLTAALLPQPHAGSTTLDHTTPSGPFRSPSPFPCLSHRQIRLLVFRSSDSHTPLVPYSLPPLTPVARPPQPDRRSPTAAARLLHASTWPSSRRPRRPAPLLAGPVTVPGQLRRGSTKIPRRFPL